MCGRRDSQSALPGPPSAAAAVGCWPVQPPLPASAAGGTAEPVEMWPRLQRWPLQRWPQPTPRAAAVGGTAVPAEMSAQLQRRPQPPLQRWLQPTPPAAAAGGTAAGMGQQLRHWLQPPPSAAAVPAPARLSLAAAPAPRRASELQSLFQCEQLWARCKQFAFGVQRRQAMQTCAEQALNERPRDATHAVRCDVGTQILHLQLLGSCSCAHPLGKCEFWWRWRHLHALHFQCRVAYNARPPFQPNDGRHGSTGIYHRQQMVRTAMAFAAAASATASAACWLACCAADCLSGAAPASVGHSGTCGGGGGLTSCVKPAGNDQSCTRGANVTRGIAQLDATMCTVWPGAVTRLSQQERHLQSPAG